MTKILTAIMAAIAVTAVLVLACGLPAIQERLAAPDRTTAAQDRVPEAKTAAEYADAKRRAAEVTRHIWTNRPVQDDSLYKLRRSHPSPRLHLVDEKGRPWPDGEPLSWDSLSHLKNWSAVLATGPSPFRDGAKIAFDPAEPGPGEIGAIANRPSAHVRPKVIE